jgi:ferredoxin
MDANRLEVVVDPNECFSFGRCIDTAPGVFSWGEDGLAVAGPVSAEDVDATLQAVESCPRMAISVVRTESDDD